MALDLTRDPLLPLLAKLSWPMMLGILSIMAMYFADSYYLAQLGVGPLAAVGFVLPIINLLSALGFGCGSAASSLIARVQGAQNTDLVQRYALQALLFGLAHAILFCIAGLIFAPTLFRWMGASEPQLKLILDYANVWFLGSYLVLIPMVANSILRALGNTLVPGLIMIVIAVVNIVLDPIFIFGGMGIPPLGIAGAAYASLCAYGIAFIGAFILLHSQIKLLSWRALSLNPAMLWRNLAAIAYPAILTSMIVPLSAGITIAIVAQYGEKFVAGLNIALRVESLVLVPLFGIASVVSPLVGQNYGAGKLRRARQSVELASRTVVIYALLASGLMFIFGWLAIDLFQVPTAVKTIAMDFVKIVFWSHSLLGVIVVTNSASNALGRPMIAAFLNCAKLLIVYLPLAFIFSQAWQVQGVYWAIALANGLVGLLALWLQRRLPIFSRTASPRY